MSDHRDDPATIRRAGVGLKRGDELGALIRPRSMAEIALNCAGFFVGLLIMTGDYVVAGRSLNEQSWEFLASPKAMVWIILVAGQFAFWATIVKPLWGWRSWLRLDYGLRLTREIRLSRHGARPGLGEPVPVAGEPQEPGGDPETAVRGGRQSAGQRLDPGTSRHERHHRPAGDEMTRTPRADQPRTPAS